LAATTRIATLTAKLQEVTDNLEATQVRVRVRVKVRVRVRVRARVIILSLSYQ
jgi:hypothetical protein